MWVNLIHSILVFREKKYCSHHSVSEFNSLSEQCNLLVNSARELHCSLFLKWTVQFSCTVHMNIVSMCIVHANYTVQWTMQLACTVREKQEFLAFHYLRFGRKNHVEPMNSKSLFFHYQTAANCVLIKTQPQPRSQTISKKV